PLHQLHSPIIDFLSEYLHNQQNHTYLTLPISKKDLPSYLPTTPQTITPNFSPFQQKPLIKQHTHKYIHIFNLHQLLFPST
ncbi:helix-turn-helix domain-containing protein, partial [Staphylococcus epidermidis]|uniref:helix-turn-helix domain-containing protein n=1 Tax=Staphylococcus epidermidis TaxID=1282 RepID=UPI00119FFD26